MRSFVVQAITSFGIRLLQRIRITIPTRYAPIRKGKFREFAVECSDADVITGTTVGGNDSLAMVGHAHMNEKFSSTFRRLMEAKINDFGMHSCYGKNFM